MSEWLPKSEHFNEDQKCSEGPKMQNKPYIFFWKQGFLKRGGGGGSDIWEKFPKNPVFWGGVASPIYLGKNCELSKWIQVGNTSIVGKLPQPTHKKDQ